MKRVEGSLYDDLESVDYLLLKHGLMFTTKDGAIVAPKRFADKALRLKLFLADGARRAHQKRKNGPKYQEYLAKLRAYRKKTSAAHGQSGRE